MTITQNDLSNHLHIKMPPKRDDIIKLCEVLAQDNNLQVTVTEAGKGAIITAVGAFAGGILGGPFGLAVGGSTAAFYAAFRSKGKYRSVVEIILYDMTEEQKDKLVGNIQNIISGVRAEDVVLLLSLVTTNLTLKEMVIKELCCFLSKEMNLSIV